MDDDHAEDGELIEQLYGQIDRLKAALQKDAELLEKLATALFIRNYNPQREDKLQ